MKTGIDVGFKKGYEVEEIQSTGESGSIPQEEHHSGHALMFLYFAVHETLLGKRIGRRLLGRIIHHLMDVREFISDPDLTDLIDRLRLSLELEYDRSLGLFIRTFHRVVMRVLRNIQGSEKGSLIASVRSFLIACWENEQVPSVCLYPWMVAHWGEILALAQHYRRDDLFYGLIEASKVKLSGGAVAKQEKIRRISKLNQILYEHKDMPIIEQQIYDFFKHCLEAALTQAKNDHEKEDTQNHKLAS